MSYNIDWSKGLGYSGPGQSGDIVGDTNQGVMLGGSMGGPWGALIGGGAGLISGLVTGGEKNKALREQKRANEALVNRYLKELEGINLNYRPEDLAATKLDPMVSVKMDSPQAMMAIKAQTDSLNRLQELARTGKDPIFQAQENQAMRRGAIEANTRQKTLEEQYSRRGLMGSGLAFASQQQAGADAQRQAAMAGEQAVANAAMRRQQAIGQAGDMASNIYGQEFNLNSRNADIANSYNARVAELAEAAKNRSISATTNQTNLAMSKLGQRNQAIMGLQSQNNALQNQKKTVFGADIL